MSGFLRRAWYMAAWSEEVGESLLRRRLLDRPVVLYRLKGGEVAALEDRCPHRFAPLSLGERIGDGIRCGYHGLEFGPTGRCTRNPFGQKVPANAVVPRWAARERDGIVWLWGGDPDEADPALIPDFNALGDNPAPIHGYTPMAADYQFGTDNLMDLSHIEFVHKGSFAGAGVIFAGEHRVSEDGDALRSDWWMPRIKAPGHTQGIYDPQMITDHWLEMRWNPPASMLLEIGATPTGRPRDEGVIVRQAHILTPETATRTHYFWATTRPGGPADPAVDEFVRSIMAQAFDGEDKPMIEAAYANLDGADFWDMRPVSLGVDAGALRARRLLQKLAAAEGSAS